MASSDFFGVVGRDPWYEFDDATGQPKRAFQEAMARQIAATGARWVRIEFHTSYVTSGVRVANTINFAETDAFINEIAPRYGLNVLALLNTGILSDQAPYNYAVKDLLDPARRERYIVAFVGQAQTIAQRYAGRIAAYEIINEPNVNAELGATTGFQQQEIPPDIYADLLTRTYGALRSVDAAPAVLVGGLLKGQPIEQPARYTTEYLRAVYAAPAVTSYRATTGRYPFDGVGLHPYPNSALPSGQWLGDSLGLVAAMGTVMADAGDPGRLWLTEIGVKATPASQPVAPATTTEEFQATWLGDLFTALTTTYANRVARAFWFKYEDFPAGTNQPEVWGLVRLRSGGIDAYDPSGAVERVKPAYAALHELAFAPASTWLFAEGYTASGFDEYLTIQNPGPAAALVVVTYLPAGAAPVVRSQLVTAGARVTLAVHDLATGVGRGWSVAARLWSSAPVIAERPVYFYYGPGWTGGHVAFGAPAPGPRWYFAEGYTAPGFDAYLTIMNPGSAEARLRLTYYRQGAPPLVRTTTVAARTRMTVAIHDEALGVGRNGGRGWEVATLVETTNGVPVVVERPIYFRYPGGITGGHTALGAPAPRSTWHFAEGYTGPGFDEYLTILNPNTSAAPVTITYYLAGGATVQRQLTVPKTARYTVAVHGTTEGVGRGQAVSATVQTSQAGGIVVERPIYFVYGDGIDGGHNVLGATAAGTRWSFAEGYTGAGFDQYLTIQNPTSQDAALNLTYYLPSGLPVLKKLVAPAKSRTTIAVHDTRLGVGRDQAVSTLVESTNGVGIIVERPIYFRYGPGWTGGHAALGYPG